MYRAGQERPHRASAQQTRPGAPLARQVLTGAYGGLYSRYLRCPFSLGLKSESSEKSEKSSLEEAWRCKGGKWRTQRVPAGRAARGQTPPECAGRARRSRST